jgi:hypothetical protein
MRALRLTYTARRSGPEPDVATRLATLVGAIRYESEESPKTSTNDVLYFSVQAIGVGGDPIAPKSNGGRVGVQYPDEPFSRMLVPEKSCHLLTDASASKIAHYEGLVNVTYTNIAEPLGCRPDMSTQ